MSFPNLSDHPRPDVVFYHYDCADGFGAAWALRRELGTDVSYVPIHHGWQGDLSELSGKNILMVDVSLPLPLIEALHETAHSFHLIDHHKTAFEKLGHLPYCHFDMERSGARIAWDYAHPEATPCPPLIDLVQARDLYRWDTVDHSRALTKALDVRGFDFDAWDQFNELLTDPRSRQGVIEEGQAMQRLFDFQVKQLCSNAVEITQQGRRGFAACVPHMFASEVGSQLSSREDGAFGFTWCPTFDGEQVRGSWRSSHKHAPIDHLAKQYENGGGHPMASGALLSWGELHALLASKHELSIQSGHRKPR